MLEKNKIYFEDCLGENGMCQIPDKSIDMILCDLPYGTTNCKWDVIIPFEPLWEQYERIIKDNGAICLFGSEPFSSLLRTSNLKHFRYDWIWNKKLAGNGLLAKRQPLKIHEIISVFSIKSHDYFPIKEKGKLRKKMFSKVVQSELHSKVTPAEEYQSDEYYPKSIIEFSLAGMRSGRLHPTQKSVELCEYLIKTYTHEGMTVLDNCAGSGTTAIAAINTNRDWICFENNYKNFQIAYDRIQTHLNN